ncbi:MAG: alkyl hydroperoxide reductase [Caulobacter sp.]|nr:alkyl hydroperoxide reductase [Caulobacter sp.]
MTGTPSESLGQLLADLHATRVATWAPEALKINVDQRRTLVESADRAGFIKAGDTVEPFSVTEVGGDEIGLDGLLADGPAVLIFFRFATCPACNIALPYYDRELWPALRALGASLTAISPQVPDRLADIKLRHDFGFNVASDLGNALGRRFGILYSYDQASRRAGLAAGNFIGDVTGTGTWELPMPTAVVIGQDRVVRYADVSPDWLDRTEAEPVIAAVRALTRAKAA